MDSNQSDDSISEDASKHVADWPVCSDGFFRRVDFELDADNVLHTSALQVARQLSVAFPQIRSVFLRGSALESDRTDRIADVDLVAVYRGHPKRLGKESDEFTSEQWNQFDLTMRCDVTYLSDLIFSDHRFDSMIELILAFRSQILTGPQVFSVVPQVKPTVELSWKLQRTHRRTVDKFMRKIYEDRARYQLERIVPWLQKKALRLGGVMSLGESGPLSRYPPRCAALTCNGVPRLSALALKVLDDFVSSTHNEWSWNRALNLYVQLSQECDSRFKRMASR